jgi:hypothetical protein
MSPFCVFILLILVSSVPGECVCTTQAGSAISKTLVFQTYYSCASTVVGSCTHNNTTYSVCFHDGQYICFNPIYCPQEQWLEVQSITSTGKLINHTWINDPTKPVYVCAAIAENTGP